MCDAGSSPTSTVARQTGSPNARTSSATSARTLSASAFPSMSVAGTSESLLLRWCTSKEDRARGRTCRYSSSPKAGAMLVKIVRSRRPHRRRALRRQGGACIRRAGLVGYCHAVRAPSGDDGEWQGCYEGLMSGFPEPRQGLVHAGEPPQRSRVLALPRGSRAQPHRRLTPPRYLRRRGRAVRGRDKRGAVATLSPTARWPSG